MAICNMYIYCVKDVCLSKKKGKGEVPFVPVVVISDMMWKTVGLGVDYVGQNIPHHHLSLVRRQMQFIFHVQISRI